MKMHLVGNRRAAWLALLLAGQGAAASQAAYVITTIGQRITGTGISAKANGEITLTIGQGAQIFLPGQYTLAVADQPPEYEQAQQLIAGKKYDQAIALLNNLVIKYQWLDWDIKASLLLAEAALQQGNPAAAVQQCEKSMTAYPRLKEDAAFQTQFRKTLIGARLFTRVEPLLAAAIGAGNRANAARAQLQRGDLRLAQGRTEEAAMDYLRTALLFTAEKELQPEALSKAAGALDKLNDKASAKMLYQKLKALYPSSPYAEQAGSNN
ncbi:MAG: hypothetical protein NTV49_06600 [Kiritimatiellaeota bacterium]|nr:hypothetical protein [Kiritimatiellota bacterium]